MNVKAILEKVVIVLLTALVSSIGAYFFFRPAPYANFSCDRYDGAAPLTVICINESQYAKRVVWDFGDGTATDNSEGPVQHIYKSSGEYEMVLTALGKSHDERLRPIVVMRTPEPASNRRLDQPSRVTITGLSSGGIERQTKTFSVNQTKNDHPSFFGTDTRTYEEVVRPDAGFRFVETRFVQRSANKASYIRSELVDGGSAIRLTFNLTSGSQTDRWRGWLSGVIEATQERDIGTQEVELVRDFEVVAPGSFSLGTNISLNSFDEIIIRDGAGDQIASGSPEEVFAIPGKETLLRLSEKLDGLVLEVAQFPREWR